MLYYPLFLKLQGEAVLVVGGGRVALRKCKKLVEAGARVTVVSPRILPEFEKLGVQVVAREFRPSDIESPKLIFAATNRREVNAEVKRCADARGIPVNVADCLEECSFLVPATLERGNVQIAVSTSGQNPRLAKQLRIHLEKLLAELDKESERVDHKHATS
ncbi:MAG: bifunctional precorrin-2 dehydrogenase/sirohydrochlorin ferrochelatase [Bryobacteraceae bacterium]|nr:bifunctional precorrin-2 dehydrogenase/sirohydrochlorin ferrochelatase [Bryobacteraceae bacterium]MDW8377359.1 bifunctional precorrin-2 dehydrogenase/sirohydrochlorin ferrochelatase [Bryobacterales bacterium]